MTSDACNLLSRESVVDQLRRAIRGEVPVALVPGGPTWNGHFCGDVTFLVGDWVIAFFNDADELDYTSHATAPDGRRGDFEEWSEGDRPIDDLCPLDLLDTSERHVLESLLEAAR